MVIKNNENCKKCMWYLGNECNIYTRCASCPNFSYSCNCSKVNSGDGCPYFRPTGSQTPHVTTPEEFKSEIEASIKALRRDYEACHVRMDELMCRVLTELGYGEGINLFENQPKWYA